MFICSERHGIWCPPLVRGHHRRREGNKFHRIMEPLFLPSLWQKIIQCDQIESGAFWRLLPREKLAFALCANFQKLALKIIFMKIVKTKPTLKRAKTQ